MRIVVLAPHFAEYAYSLACALAAQHEVLLIAEEGNFTRELGTSTPPISIPGLRIQMVARERSLASIVSSARVIVRVIRAFRPDVIHAQEVIFDFIALAVLRLRRYPLVLTVHDPNPHTGEEYRGIRRRYDYYRRFLRRCADAAIVHGSDLRRQLEEACPKLSGRVHAVPHGILGRLPTDPPLNSPTQHPISVLFLGRMHPYKGLDIFLDAMDLIGPRAVEVVTVIAGRGPALDAVRDRVTERPATRVVDRYLGRAEMLRLVDDATVIALPYLDGTQSGIALLAIGRGRAMVGTRVGSLPEVVRHDRNGLLVASGDTTALADAIAELIDSPSTNARFRAENEAMALGEFSWNTIADHTLAVYQHAVSRRRSWGRVEIRHGRLTPGSR